MFVHFLPTSIAGVHLGCVGREIWSCYWVRLLCFKLYFSLNWRRIGSFLLKFGLGPRYSLRSILIIIILRLPSLITGAGGRLVRIWVPHGTRCILALPAQPRLRAWLHLSQSPVVRRHVLLAMASELASRPSQEERDGYLVKFFKPYFSRLPNYNEHGSGNLTIPNPEVSASLSDAALQTLPYILPTPIYRLSKPEAAEPSNSWQQPITHIVEQTWEFARDDRPAVSPRRPHHCTIERFHSPGLEEVPHHIYSLCWYTLRCSYGWRSRLFRSL